MFLERSYLLALTDFILRFEVQANEYHDSNHNQCKDDASKNHQETESPLN